MDCREFLRHFSSLCDRELDSKTTSSCEAHLRQCPSCQRLFKAYKTGVEQFNALPSLEVPEDLYQRVIASVDRQPEVKVIPWKKPVFWVPAAAAAIVLFVLSFTLFQPSGDVTSYWNLSAVDPTMDVVDMQHWSEFEQADNYVTGSAKARLASWEPTEDSPELNKFAFEENYDGEDAVFSYGVSRHPVIVLGGVAQSVD